MSPDGRLLATVESRRRAGVPDTAPRSERYDTLVRVYDSASQDLHSEINLSASYSHHLAFSPDGRQLAVATHRRSPELEYENWISLWHIETGRESARIDGPMHRVSGLAFSPDGHRLASSHADATVVIWDLQQFRLSE